MDLQDLYQQVILDHNRAPRNFGPLEGADREAEGFNPLCGDLCHVYLRLGEGGERIEEARFAGHGCAISKASASLMTEAVRGLGADEARHLMERFRAMVTGEEAEGPARDLGRLAALGGVRAFPMRVKCASLPWHTLRAALDGRADQVTTE